MRDSLLSMARGSRLHIAVGLLLAFSLLVGLAHIFLLPPWEGFDETAHFSYIQQLAETHKWPNSAGRRSSEVGEYEEFAPLPYSPVPPYDRDRPWTYHGFFSSPAGVVASGWKFLHTPREGSRSWNPGTGSNWEAQHPPLYYSLLAPFYALSRSWNLLNQLLLLRIVSYGFAWLSLCLMAIAVRPREQTIPAGMEPRSAAFLAAALWPYLFPMWFPEMARLGNDGLVALFATVVWMALRGLILRNDRLLDYVAVGFLSGLGLLTKATFLPFVAVVAAFLAYRAWQARRDIRLARNRFLGLVVMVAMVAATASWWYLGKFLETGNAFGITNMQHPGGFWALLRKPVWALLFRTGFTQITISFLWNGTWSFVEPPTVAFVPLLAILPLVIASHLRWLGKAASGMDWIPIWTLAVFSLGLVYNQLVFIAAYGVAGIPGWYLHALAPVLSFLVGASLLTLPRWRGVRIFLLCLLVYPLLFLPGVAFLEVLTYSGCGRKIVPGWFHPSLSFEHAPSAASCVTGASQMFRNLSVLGSPRVALVCFLIGYLAAVAGITVVMRMPAGRSAP